MSFEEKVVFKQKYIVPSWSQILSQGAKNVVAATLFMKPWIEYVPEFFGEKTDAWIIFPHEIREMIESLSSRWRKKGKETGFL